MINDSAGHVVGDQLLVAEEVFVSVSIGIAMVSSTYERAEDAPSPLPAVCDVNRTQRFAPPLRESHGGQRQQAGPA